MREGGNKEVQAASMRIEQGLILGSVHACEHTYARKCVFYVFVRNFVASDALHIVNIVTFKKNLQFCREKLLIHKLTSLPPSLPPSLYLGCACYRKDKRNSLKGEKRESQSYLWRDWFACLQAAIPIMPVLGECVSMRPSPLPHRSPHSLLPSPLLPPPHPESIHSQIYLCISLQEMECCSCQMH